MRRLFPRFRIALLRATFASASGVALGATGVPAQEVIDKSGEADREIVVREHAGWDSACAAIAPPSLHLDAPPLHGIVCARNDDIRIAYIAYGTQSQCIGRTVRGLRLVYRPHAGYAGSDGLRYTVQYPKSRRDVAVSVTVMPPAPATSGAAPASIAVQPLQAPGAIPPCNDFLS
jgi:hypothetical protein